MIQRPFTKHCPPTRANSISYTYVLFKFCQLLEEDMYLAYFPLLKSRAKLKSHDDIWKNICTDLNWEFIRSI
jgi:Poxvirus Late Transcription Factor VLTF3 like